MPKHSELCSSIVNMIIDEYIYYEMIRDNADVSLLSKQWVQYWSSIQNYNNTGQQLVNANQLYAGVDNNYSNLLKNKTPTCNTPWPLNMSQSGRYQNKKFCYYNQLPNYQMPKTQPSTYRYYPGTVFSSNHYSQSPNTYNTTTGTAAYK